jgi:Uma2 family endonuclease
MIAITPKPLTVEEYLTLEKVSEIRHEFVDGLMVAMAGETRLHKRIAGNIYRLLFDLGVARGCEVMLEAKIRTRSSRYRYPDVVVSCAPGDDEYFLENPCLLIEVLSESTANTDTSEKLDEYLKLPSLQRYVLVDQTTCRVIVYARATQGWMVEVLDSDGQFDVPCLETNVTLEQIYAGVNFATVAEPISESVNLEPD